MSVARSFGVIAAIIALSSCAQTGNESSKSKQAIDTFLGTCNQALGDVDQIRSLAQARGFVEQPQFQPLISGNGALLENESLGQTIQLNVATGFKFECAVTTDDVANPKWFGNAFYSAVGGTTKEVNGKTYGYLHDTKGGETLVVFSN